MQRSPPCSTLVASMISRAGALRAATIATGARRVPAPAARASEGSVWVHVVPASVAGSRYKDDT